jgi:5-methyltetrahydrofolate--homocysteine methyltransferase
VRRLRDELGVNTTCGASNVSFGLPGRHGLAAAFLPMAIQAGLTSAIMNPTRAAEMEAVAAADLLMGRDANAGRWLGLAKVMEQVRGGTPLAEAMASRATGAGRSGRRRRRG